MTLLREHRCGNCVFAKPLGPANPLRVLCEHEPTPLLHQCGAWPRVYVDDSCGYWTKDEAG